MTKTEAIAPFGTQRALAKMLKIAPAAVAQWPEDKIPELRAYQIREYLSQQKEVSANANA